MIAARGYRQFLFVVIASFSITMSAYAQDTTKPAKSSGGKSAADTDAELLIKEQARRDAAKLIRKPLLTETPEEQIAAFKKIKTQFGNVLTKGPLIGNRKNEELVKSGLRLMILRMSNKGEADLAAEYSKDVKYRYRQTGTRVPSSQRAAHRERVARIIADNCEKLMDNQLAVRVNAVAIMNVLYLDIPKNGPPVAWSKLPDYLLKIIKDEKQFLCVKVTAVAGLNVFLQCDKVTTTHQNSIANELIRQLGLNLPAPEIEKAIYQQAICRTLSRLRIPLPAASQAIYKVLANKKSTIRARAAAAYALGRLPVAGLNPEDIAISSVELMWEIGSNFNKNPDSEKWLGFAGDTYLAFRHANENEKRQKAGLMNRAATVKVQKAFELILPVMAHLTRDARLGDDEDRTSVSREHLKKMRAWLDTQNPKGVASKS